MIHPSLERIFQEDFSSFFLIAGPCAVESYDTCAKICDTLVNKTSELDIPLVFKASYRKANRTSGDSFRGIGDQEALAILAKIKQSFGVAITTDIHESIEIRSLVDIVDLIQIPAFLSRQTALIEAAAMTGLPVNIKKAQFMSSDSAIAAGNKAKAIGNHHVLLTERGNSFGYHELIVDMRNIKKMSSEYQIVMDCSHATQRPNASTGVTGGNANEIEHLALSAIVSGAQGLFIETHPDPRKAKSDSESMLPLDDMGGLLSRAKILSLAYRSIYD